MIVTAQTPRLVVDEPAQAGEAVGHREHFVDLLLVLVDRELHLGVLEHIGHLLGDRIGIERHRHGTERLAGAHRPIELRPVAADDGELVAPGDPELLQPDRECADLVEDLSPGPGLPDAEILVADGGPRADRLRVVDEELRERIRVSVGGSRHGAILPVLRAAERLARATPIWCRRWAG